MTAIEFTEPRYRGPFSAPCVVSQRLANQLRLRPPFAGGKLTKSKGEIGIQINSGLRHLPYMVPYL